MQAKQSCATCVCACECANIANWPARALEVCVRRPKSALPPSKHSTSNTQVTRQIFPLSSSCIASCCVAVACKVVGSEVDAALTQACLTTVCLSVDKCESLREIAIRAVVHHANARKPSRWQRAELTTAHHIGRCRIRHPPCHAKSLALYVGWLAQRKLAGIERTPS